MAETKNRIIVMGGSFNPPTLAHFKLMKAALDALVAEIGIFVPVSDAYLKRKMRNSHPPVVLSPELRVKMLQAMCSQDNRMRVNEIEIGTIAASTMPTMMAIQAEHPESELFFVMGADKLDLLAHLTESRGFLDAFGTVLYSRENDTLEQFLIAHPLLSRYRNRIVLLPQPEGTEAISSSLVRERMLSGLSSRELLCPGVWELFKDLSPKDFPDVINRFKDEFAFLGNSFKCRIRWQGRDFKCAGDAYRSLLQLAVEDPDLMRAIVQAKFAQNPHLMKMLSDTGDRILINGNGKRETFWGIDLYSWEGENHLGRILMEIRDQEKEK